MKAIDIINEVDRFQEFKNAISRFDCPLSMRVQSTTIFNSYGVRILIGDYAMETVFKCRFLDDEYGELDTYFFRIVNDEFKPFMIKPGLNKFRFISHVARGCDYYSYRIARQEWNTQLYFVIEEVSKNINDFVKMCDSSSPYKSDGSHKYNSWRNTGMLTICRLPKAMLIQGVTKYDRSPSGLNVRGDNGTYKVHMPGEYSIKCLVNRISLEQPIKKDIFINVDSYIRRLMSRNGWDRPHYDIINGKLKDRINLITYDMNVPPTERLFYPEDYNNDWERLLDEKLVGL